MQMSLVLNTADGDTAYNSATVVSSDGVTLLLTSGGQEIFPVYTFQDVYTGSDAGYVQLRDLDEMGFGLQNPCGITISATLPDI